MKGLEAAAAAGIVAGKQEKKLEVIADVTPEQTKAIRAYLDQTDIKVRHVENGVTFDIILTVWKGEHSAQVRIAVFHTNIVHVEKDGEVLVDIPVHGDDEETLTDRSLLDMEHIWDFANTVDVEDVRSILEPQIRCNMAIAEEGLRGNYGANIGSVLLDMEGNDVRVRAKAYAAAGSDARMNGCEQPVVINSGSGNQGITTSVPVIVYAQELGVSDETLLRALTLSNLTTIHEKTPIGRLSAYCGAISAGAGAGAGIAYLCGGDYDAVIHTVVNALAVVSGVICDGAKASCAAKIATAVEAGLLGNYGANIGSVLLDMEGNDVRVRAKAYAAAGSDARMNGCEQPVVINSGSGNQGITTSVPVIVYAQELGVSDETLLRALTLSNLTTIHEKTPIGRLSAYCGAISAGAGAGAGIAYLCGGDYDAVIHTVVNALAVVSGVICDGAKASCAAKIATAVEAGLLGYNMYIRGNQFRAGDGIVAKGVENSLKNVGRLGKQGMKETNNEIIAIMVGC